MNNSTYVVYISTLKLTNLKKLNIQLMMTTLSSDVPIDDTNPLIYVINLLR